MGKPKGKPARTISGDYVTSVPSNGWEKTKRETDARIEFRRGVYAPEAYPRKVGR